MPPTCHGYCLVLVPVLIGVFGPVMLVTCYTIAVLHGDVSKLFPYISDTGGDPPESCIFGQLLNIIALFVFAGVMLRYKQVSSMVLPLGIKRVSGLATFVGCLAALGASLVANFQDTTVVMVHYVGAMLLFLFGIIYCLCQTYVSYHINFHINRKWICHLRMVLSVIAAVSLVICLVGSNIAEKGWKEHHVSPSIYKWGPQDGGYAAHLVSTFSEWAMSVTLMGYFVTFIPDFLNLSGYVSHLVGVSSESLMSLSLLIFFFTFISDLVDAQFTISLMTNAVFRLSTNWETSVEISSDSIIGRRVFFYISSERGEYHSPSGSTCSICGQRWAPDWPMHEKISPLEDRRNELANHGRRWTIF